MKKFKLAAALFLVLGGGAFLATPEPVDAEGDCIYAEYVLGEICYGATTRFCKGPPDCIKEN